LTGSPCWFFETLKFVFVVWVRPCVEDKGHERKGVAERGHGPSASVGGLPGSAVRRSVFRSGAARSLVSARVLGSPSSVGCLGFGWSGVAGECSGGCQLRLGCLWAPLRLCLRGQVLRSGRWVSRVLRLTWLCFKEEKGHRRHGFLASAGECRAFERSKTSKSRS
jgi:hypothetical protein